MKYRVFCNIDRIVEADSAEDAFDKAFRLTPAERFFAQPYYSWAKEMIDKERKQKDEQISL